VEVVFEPRRPPNSVGIVGKAGRAGRRDRDVEVVRGGRWSDREGWVDGEVVGRGVYCLGIVVNTLGIDVETGTGTLVVDLEVDIGTVEIDVEAGMGTLGMGTLGIGTLGMGTLGMGILDMGTLGTGSLATGMAVGVGIGGGRVACDVR